MYNGLGSSQIWRDCFKVGLKYGRVYRRKWQSISGVFYMCYRLSVDTIQHLLIIIPDSWTKQSGRLNEGNLEFVERYWIVDVIDRGWGIGSSCWEVAVSGCTGSAEEAGKGWDRKEEYQLVLGSTRGCGRAGVWHWVGGRWVGRRLRGGGFT